MAFHHYKDISMKTPIKARVTVSGFIGLNIYIYLHNEWKPWIITILWLARHYSHINMVAGAGLVWWCTVQSALSSINCTERFLVLRQKHHSYERNMCWKHFFIKSYHKIQLFVRPFNFKINIMENRKTHFIVAVIEWVVLFDEYYKIHSITANLKCVFLFSILAI